MTGPPPLPGPEWQVEPGAGMVRPPSGFKFNLLPARLLGPDIVDVGEEGQINQVGAFRRFGEVVGAIHAFTSLWLTAVSVQQIFLA